MQPEGTKIDYACIMTRYIRKILASALGICLGLKLYFTVNTTSRHNTDTEVVAVAAVAVTVAVVI